MYLYYFIYSCIFT